MRTPRRGRSKSIVVLKVQEKPRNFPIGRLNNYNKNLRKLKGPLSMANKMEHIAESLDDKEDESKDDIQVSES